MVSWGIDAVGGEWKASVGVGEYERVSWRMEQEVRAGYGQSGRVVEMGPVNCRLGASDENRRDRALAVYGIQQKPSRAAEQHRERIWGAMKNDAGIVAFWQVTEDVVCVLLIDRGRERN